MATIHILDSATIDKIAAGEVVERPVSVVKELVENAIDAGANHITVEIKDGGVSMIRVTDDGCGIEESELGKVFYRHATSKIEKAEDLSGVLTLGFRGEALSSVSAVAKVELITKPEKQLVGSRMVVNGGIADEIEQIGAPNGTTIVVRDLFYNTPPRKKFLKSNNTEGSYINEYMQHLALSAPGVAFQFVMNGQTKFFTSGNGDIREIIYRIFGKDVSGSLLPFEAEMPGASIRGYIGKPVLARANRRNETLFVNGRYIKSSLLSYAIEEGYKTLLMQHKYPFVVLHFTIDPAQLDVNVHPTKLDIRISDPADLLKLLAEKVAETLTGGSLIQPHHQGEEKVPAARVAKEEKALTKELPQPFETNRLREQSSYGLSGEEQKEGHRLLGLITPKKESAEQSGIIKQRDVVFVEKPVQMELFDEVDIRAAELENFKILGQVFDTYWVLTMGSKLYYVDQHAAHEKVMYERLMKRYREKDVFGQPLNPPIILTLTPAEALCLEENKSAFLDLGFETEDFGENSYALRTVPMDLYGCSEKELFMSALDSLMEGPVKGDVEAITSKIASMSCKAAVKGNSEMSMEEARALFEEMFRCDNPYHCPHGRPTMISVSKAEMEKRFHR